MIFIFFEQIYYPLLDQKRNRHQRWAQNNFFCPVLLSCQRLSWRAAGQDENSNVVLSWRTGPSCPVLISDDNCRRSLLNSKHWMKFTELPDRKGVNSEDRFFAFKYKNCRVFYWDMFCFISIYLFAYSSTRTRKVYRSHLFLTRSSLNTHFLSGEKLNSFLSM